VADTGIGIAPDKIGSLFEDFVQADRSISRRFGGSGLGLAICKRLIEQMGGQIAVVSRPQSGSTFSFSLNLRIAERVEAHESDHREVTAELRQYIADLGRPLRILIVDDNATNRFVATRMLEEFDIQTNMACDGVEAVTAARRFSYDLILMDVRMPEMDGLQATRSIRATVNRSQNIPVIAFTANAFAEDLEVCLEAGMNGFVAKPVRKIKLVEAILQSLSSAVGRNERHPETPAPAPKPVAATANRTAGGGAFAQMIVEIGEESAHEMLGLFLSETKARLLRLRKLSSLDDRPTLEREAHSLKSAAAMFDQWEMAETARMLERDALTIDDRDCQKRLVQIEQLFDLFLQHYPAWLNPAPPDAAIGEGGRKFTAFDG
jgi:CheY-like chemotaxis protein/HPt (histidine-containing phosphotransfer) domain-containing protein